MNLRKMVTSLIPSGWRQLRRERMYRRRFGLSKIGRTTPRWISPTTSFGRHCRINGPVYVLDSTIGDYSYLETDVRVSCAHIGKFVSVGPRAQVGLAMHPLGANASLHPAFYRYDPTMGYEFVDGSGGHEEFATTVVGNDVWIGASALVLGGLTLGDGAVVAAGAVVVKDVPPYAVVGGVPAKVLRHRFDEPTIAFLERLRWWDRSDDWLKEHGSKLRDVAELRAAFEGTDVESEESAA